MKPLLSEFQDKESLATLGRASVQIVHDLRNQLNGLKLYATFLGKRMEKTERPADESETVNKLISGLNRIADDLSIIVQYGQPLVPKRQPGIDLQTILREVVTVLNNRPRRTGALLRPVVIHCEAGPLVGEFDSAMLVDALKSISLGAMEMTSSQAQEELLRIQLKVETVETRRDGVIEWPVLDSSDHDPFHSFAGSAELKMSLAAKAIEAHGGVAERQNGCLRVRLPLAP